MARNRKTQQPLTTAQQLGSLIKSARDIMRKDKGLSGDLDRLPMLTWVMFLKFLDDMEKLREDEALLGRKKYKPIVDPPYRWRDWAASENALTGEDLIAFINQEKATRPDGTEGPGLFAYLRKLQSANGRDRRDVIATVFSGVVNRMINGYLLRDVINKINGIHFTSSEEIHTLGHMYESMLREMRDAAGDAGEFYTPRAVVKFIVSVIDPKLGETILDPACGTSGFLSESYEHLAKQCKTVEDRRKLQEESIFGQEAKPLPFLLAQMNLLLHGLEYPRIEYGNSLARKITEIGESERVDVIMTNPPFGGEEEEGIKNNFPADKQTSETALLFLQLIMRKLRHRGRLSGRAAVIVPDSLLSARGVACAVRRELVTDFNLHTIVRLPPGVFSPYTPIPTNILFFARGGPTLDTWYYDVSLPSGMREYTKTRPLRNETLEPLAHWWRDRTENSHAWRIHTASIRETDDVDLDCRNPRIENAWGSRRSDDLVAMIRKSTRDAMEKAEALHEILARTRDVDRHFPSTLIPLAQFLKESRDAIEVKAAAEYPNFGIYSYGRGTFEKPPIQGIETSAGTLFRVRAGQFIYSRLFAFEGAFAIIPREFDGWFVSNEYPTFDFISDEILPQYLLAYFRAPQTWSALKPLSKGLGHRRQRVHPERLLTFSIPLPSKTIQQMLVDAQELERSFKEASESATATMHHIIPALVHELE